MNNLELRCYATQRVAQLLFLELNSGPLKRWLDRRLVVLNVLYYAWIHQIEGEMFLRQYLVDNYWLWVSGCVMDNYWLMIGYVLSAVKGD